MADVKKVATRDSYGNALVELGAEHDDFVVLDADLAAATKTGMFKAAYPDRFFDAGIAESNLMGLAAGIATIAKSVAVALGRKNIPTKTSSNRALKRIIARERTLSEYLSEMISVIEQSDITISTPMRRIPAGLIVLKKLNSLGVSIEVYSSLIGVRNPSPAHQLQ